jgi:lactose/L-arabinose transport system substrate-binding protein
MSGDDGIYRIMLNQQGSFYFTKDGKIDLTSDASKKAMEMLKKMVDAKIIKNTTGWDAGLSAITNGKVAASITGCWMAGLVSQQAPDLKGKWGMFALPSFEKGGNHAANLGGSNWLIPTSGKNQDLAYKFLSFFSTTDKIQELAMQGGLFPTLNTVYSSTLFTTPDEYFNNQKIWESFANETKDIPGATYTGNYSVAHDEAVKAQSEVLMSKKDIEKSLDAATKRLENRLSNKK